MRKNQTHKRKNEAGTNSHLQKNRDKGFGKSLVEYLISQCRQKDATEIIIHAQYTLKEFYEELGFMTRVKTFIEADIRHIEMYVLNKKGAG